ncbi:hypothetical protein B0O99DRAFT_247599 [Bisporella sp. PMI_857]|jgi:hypothetical protein|nr:hypothetical protein B0O99DRAFT_247599 [Bisporella sp. PMI_857]
MPARYRTILYPPQSFTRLIVSAPPSLPRKFPTSDFIKIDTATEVEEETLPFYVAEDYYPVY